jgi:DNA-binding NtrC family response regulator
VRAGIPFWKLTTARQLSCFSATQRRTLSSAIGECGRWGGEKFLQHLRAEPRLASIPVIVITAFGSSRSAIEAIRLGAYDFVTKPFDLDEIVLTAERALDHSLLNRDVERLRANEGSSRAAVAGRLIGSSGIMLDVFIMIGKVAETDSTVLICGESGTGKELVAEAIHDYSQRKDKPFVVVNCAALPDNLLETELFGHERGAFTGATARKIGRFEMAESGTIFLDEIGELSSSLQSKLLRFCRNARLNVPVAPRPFVAISGFSPLRIGTLKHPCAKRSSARTSIID